MYKNYDIKSAWKKDDFNDSSWTTYLSDNQREKMKNHIHISLLKIHEKLMFGIVKLAKI